jgi:hypothetical protein
MPLSAREEGAQRYFGTLTFLRITVVLKLSIGRGGDKAESSYLPVRSRVVRGCIDENSPSARGEPGSFKLCF